MNTFHITALVWLSMLAGIGLYFLGTMAGILGTLTGA